MHQWQANQFHPRAPVTSHVRKRGASFISNLGINAQFFGRYRSLTMEIPRSVTMMPPPTSVEVFMKSWKQISDAVDSVDECTAPTSMSVDNSATRVDWPDGVNPFRTSEVGSARATPSPPLVTSPPTTAAKPPRGGGVTPTVAADGGEARRRLHYKERLRRLTDRFMTETAKAHLGRSRPAFSTTVPAAEAEDTDAADDDDFGASRDKTWFERAFDIQRMTSSCGCLLAMLTDDDDTHHFEGYTIDIPNKKHHPLTMPERSYNSDISSITDSTPQRFKKRYDAEDVSDGMRWSAHIIA